MGLAHGARLVSADTLEQKRALLRIHKALAVGIHLLHILQARGVRGCEENMMDRKLASGISLCIFVSLVLCWQIYLVMFITESAGKLSGDDLQALVLSNLILMILGTGAAVAGTGKLHSWWKDRPLSEEKIVRILSKAGFLEYLSLQRDRRKVLAGGYNSGVIVFYLISGRCFAREGDMDLGYEMSQELKADFRSFDPTWASVPRLKDLKGSAK